MTTLKESPIAPLSMNANEAINSTSSIDDNEIIEYEPIEGTPLYLHGTKSRGYSVVIKDAILTQPFKSKKDLLNYVKSKPWELLITVMTFVCDTYHILKNQNETSNANQENKTEA